jgi:uncharacterized membrane protein
MFSVSPDRARDGASALSSFRKWLAIRYVTLINLILVVALLTTVATSLLFGIERGQQSMLFSSTFGGVIDSICAVISHEKYQSGRYVCLNAAAQQMRSVGLAYDDSTLAHLGKTLPEWLADGAFLDRALDKLFALPRLPADGDVQDIGWGMDAGYMDFTELAFNLFGHNLEALYYTFFSLLLFSVTLYCIQFWQRTFALFTALSFHFAFLSYLPALNGLELYSANNYRLLSLLAVTPLFHALFAILCNLRPTPKNLLLFTPQAFLLAAAGDFRSLAYIAAIAFAFYCCLFLIYESRWRKKNLRSIVSACWPLAIILICVSSSIALPREFKDRRIESVGGMTNHSFWEPLYYDLQLNPEWNKKYAQQHKGATGDDTTKVAVQSYRERHGLLHNKSDFINGDETQGLSHRSYEKYTREAYIEFIRNDPWYIVQLKSHDLLDIIRNLKDAISWAWSSLNWYIAVFAILVTVAVFFQIQRKVESLRTLTVANVAVAVFVPLFAAPIWITVPVISSCTDVALLADTFTFVMAQWAILTLALWLNGHTSLIKGHARLKG